MASSAPTNNACVVTQADWKGWKLVLTQGQVEAELQRLSDRLESETMDFAKLIVEAAEHEAAYKHRFNSLLIHEANRNATQQEKITAAVRDARVHLLCKDEYALYKLFDARVEASRESMRSLRHQLNALQTLSANIRAQT